MKKIIAISTSLLLLFGSIGLVYADPQEELNRINAEKAELNKALQAGKQVENSLNKEIKGLESQIANRMLQIQQLGANIEGTEQEINRALAELNALEADIALQQESLNKRLRVMYMNGNTGVVDVILGSESISDMMSNMDKVQRIYEADKELLESLEEQHNQIKQQREQLESLRLQLQQAKEAQATEKSALESDKSQVQKKKSAVASDNRAIEEQIDIMNQQAAAFTAEILKLQGNQSFVGGEFTWPSPGVSRITSPFGNRLHPILKYNKLHTGIDIGCPSNTTIVAANAGTVIKSGWNNSYGNVIMIDHGGGIVTVYAHNNTLLVSTGAVVAKGQAIAKSGSTGMSTGPHLHFEVRVNGQYVNPTGYVAYGR